MTANGGALAMALAEKTDWQVVCESGRLAAAQLDDGRWILGDLASLVEKEYGEDKMGDFARECNVPKKRIYEYRQVAGYWQSSVRAELWEIPTVTYSLMRLAMRLENVNDARRFVERMASKDYSVDYAHVLMGRLLGLAGKRQRRPKKLVDAQAALVSVNVAAGCIELSFPLDQRAKLQALSKTGRGEIVRLVVYAIT